MTFKVRRFMGETIHPDVIEKDQSVYVLLEDHLKAMKEQKSKFKEAWLQLKKDSPNDVF